MELNSGIGWHPEHVRDGRFGRWLEGNVDWAISRERYWGTPLPLWRCGDCDAVTAVGGFDELRDRAVNPPGQDFDPHRPYVDDVVVRCDCGGEARRVPEVIDVWYDSGAMPFAQHHYPFAGEDVLDGRFPADYICEAQDQTRGWFYSLHAEATMLFDSVAYRNVVCLGLILDGDGQKMSKSRGNVIEPWSVLERSGADPFRWYLLTAQQAGDSFRFSFDAIDEAMRRFLLTLWNTYTYKRQPTPSSSPTRPCRTAGHRATTRRRSRTGRRSTAGPWRAWPRPSTWSPSGWTTTTPPARGGRSPVSSTSSPTGTCGPAVGASGARTTAPTRPPPSRPFTSVW